MTVTGLGSASTWGALAQSVGTPKPGQPAKPAYGLAFRFVVKLDDMTDLGGWQTCSGLKVEFKADPVRSGGHYAGNTWVPSELVWSKIVLKRAVNASDTKKVQDYLQKFGRDWVSGTPAEPQGGVITLYDGTGKAVLKWELTRVRPAAWSGPDLDATSGKVAVETLELVHEGFKVVPAGTAPAGAGGPPGSEAADIPPPLVLQSARNQGDKVEFPFPPVSITAAKTFESPSAASRTSFTARGPQVSDKGKGSGGEGGQGAGQAGGANGQTVIGDTGFEPNILQWSLAPLRLEGEGILAAVNMLDQWTTKQPLNKIDNYVQEPLTWSWGEQFTNMPVFLKKLDAKFTRFNSKGVPIRAEITLGFNMRRVWKTAKPSKGAARGTGPAIGNHRSSAGRRNPTSGGIPGRASHLVLESENLATLALTTYSDPGRWRVIAETNRLDDPLRVKPGMTLFLPSPLETTS